MGEGADSIDFAANISGSTMVWVPVTTPWRLTEPSSTTALLPLVSQLLRSRSVITLGEGANYLTIGGVVTSASITAGAGADTICSVALSARARSAWVILVPTSSQPTV